MSELVTRVFVGQAGEHFFATADGDPVAAVPGQTYQVTQETADAFPDRFRPEGSTATVSELDALRAEVAAANARATAAEDRAAEAAARAEEAIRDRDAAGGKGAKK